MAWLCVTACADDWLICHGKAMYKQQIRNPVLRSPPLWLASREIGLIVFSLPSLEGDIPRKRQGYYWAADLNLSPEKVSTDTVWDVVLEHVGIWGVFSLVTLLGVFPGADLRGWNARLRTCRGGGVLVSLAGKNGKKKTTNTTLDNKRKYLNKNNINLHLTRNRSLI